MEAYLNNQWYTTNITKSKLTKSLSNLYIDYEEIKLLSVSSANNLYDDFGGEYNSFDYQWITNDEYATIFHTIFKVYKDGDALSFVQYFPNGATGTNFINETVIPKDCEGRFIPNPILSFPSFTAQNNTDNNNVYSQYSLNNLGWLTWSHTFSIASYNKGILSTDNLAGVNGGPIVLYDQDGKAMVISPADHFSESTQTASNPIYNIGTYMFDYGRNDSLLCFSYECYAANGISYVDREEQGLNYVNNQLKDVDDNDLMPLNLFYSSKYLDNCVTTNMTGPDSSYSISLVNGYVVKSNVHNNSDLFALDLYYNAELHDHATVATEDLKKELLAKNYTFVARQGYVVNTTWIPTLIKPSSAIVMDRNYKGDGNGDGDNDNNLGHYNVDNTNDWQMGISNSYLSIPSNFTHETVIVQGNGINNVMVNEFGSRMQSLYETNRIGGDEDILTSKLGYWTDDGAYYYGDSWSESGTLSNPKNLSCCSLEVFDNVKKELDEMEVPIQYWQMDDWWYDGTSVGNENQWRGISAVKEWEPPQSYYSGGLQALSTSLDVPLLLYGPYFSPTNQWSGQFEFIPDDGTYVLPTPSQSYDFYSTIMKYGISSTQSNDSSNSNNTGMIGYEVDFMSCLSETPYFRLNINSQQDWLNGMNKAAKELGIIIQYCMSIPMNLLSSLSLSQVTNGRASDDYAANLNFNIGASALLWYSLGLKPSKDNFWSTFPQPSHPKFRPNGNDQSSCEMHCIVAILSCGPVGISDAIGYTNSTLIMRTTRADGRLLQPNRPITAINDQYLLNIFKYNNQRYINIWSTESGYRVYNNDIINNNKKKNKNKKNIVGYSDDVVNIYQIVLAVDMSRSYPLTYESFEANNGLVISNMNDYIIRKWHNSSYCINGTHAIESGCVSYQKAQDNMYDSLYTFVPQKAVKPSNESFELVLITQANSMNEIVLLGELDKYVSVSEHRFGNLVINGKTISVDIRGKVGEIVNLSMLYPSNNGTKEDWMFITENVKIGSSGISNFVIQ